MSSRLPADDPVMELIWAQPPTSSATATAMQRRVFFMVASLGKDRTGSGEDTPHCDRRRRSRYPETAMPHSISPDSSAHDLRLVVDTMPVMAWIVLPDGRLDFLNRPWLEYSGLSMKDAIADPAGTIHPDDLSRVMGKWPEHLASGKPFEDEMRLRRADGEYRWFLVRTVALRDASGKILRWYGTSTDIEDRKRAEGALRESERLLREAQELGHTGSWEQDLVSGKIVNTDENVRLFFGDDTTKGARLEDYFEAVHPDDRDYVARRREQLVAERGPGEIEFRVV